MPSNARKDLRTGGTGDRVSIADAAPVVAMAEFDKYLGPNVAVDIAVLTLDEGGLAVLVQDRTKAPRGKVLPGRFLRKGETVGDGLGAALMKVGLDIGPIDAALDGVAGESHPIGTPRVHLVGVFDKPGRDKRSTWSMSLAYYLVQPRDRLREVEGEFVPVGPDGSIKAKLLFDHEPIVKKAAAELRAQYELTPDPENLCGTDEITLPQLQAIHQSVLGEDVRTDTFRRRMEAMLTKVPDPDDPTGARQKTCPSGDKGGPPTRVWKRLPAKDGTPRESHRLLQLPRDPNPRRRASGLPR